MSTLRGQPLHHIYALEREESVETEGAILRYIRTPDDRGIAERVMRELHNRTKAYTRGLGREYLRA